MTRIVLIVDPAYAATYTIDDPRPPREIMVAVNTGQLEVGKGEINLAGLRQWAMAHTAINVVTIALAPPPVELTRRQYEVLFGLAENKTAAEIAAALNISPRTVSEYIRELKERFGVRSKEELIVQAREYGMLGD